MKRHVVFITNSGQENFVDSPLSITVDNYKSYFRAPYGGGWEPNEMLHVDQPQKDVLMQMLDQLTLHWDYSIVIFCGPVLNGNDGTKSLKINDQDEIPYEALRHNATKRLILVENLVAQNEDKDIEDLGVRLELKKESIHGLILNTFDCKKYYNKRIINAPDQVIEVFAPRIPISPNFGTFYSAFMLKSARLMVKERIRSTDLKESFGFNRFPVIQEETNSLLSTNKIAIDAPHIMLSEAIQEDDNMALIFGIVA